ncbi:hypothetical protein Vadar_000712 [Vaccinium darrowii]|uniref:Uncharacterized protein n=1 Tax=Vaccinium darrowii TaxID=229202 RepID=A0ACB7X762_9ERIC|nr:hypothetical protein Vadar_000712 [Vaccinium darrowii]
MSHETKILCSIFLLLLQFQFQFQFCTPTDIINTTQSLKDGDLLISGNQNFALGFFTPGKSTNRYLGIWFNKVSGQAIVWVANRGDPINDTSGSLSFDSTGNLVITGPDQNNPVWFTNVSNLTLAKNSSAQLLDTGNLVLLDSNKVVVWQSFDYPTDTVLPYLRFGVDRKSGLNRFVTSWKSRDDPGLGEYSFKIDLNGSPQGFLYKGSDVLWRAGPWMGRGWSGIPNMTPNDILNISYVENQDEVTFSYSIRNTSSFSYLVLNESGTIEGLAWNDNEHHWLLFHLAPKDPCDNYNFCGPNGNCDPINAGMGHFDCSCLPGFEPKSASDWNLRYGSGGCVRKQGGHVCGNGEGFVKVARAKVPNTWMARVNKSILALKGCEVECLRNCTCNGYASADVSHGDDGGGCVMWFGDLIDTRVFPSGGQDFYVRVDAVELEQYLKSQHSHGNKGKVAAIAASVTAALLLTFCLFCWFVVKKRKETREEQNLLFSPYNTTSLEASSMGKHFDGSGTNAELPYFDLSIIVSATDNFSLANKLGEDFGMARIFGGDQIEANTNRVVGTYGYMSPEYAMEGQFSIKSDVFSFGVLLLEIISGRKNSSYYKDNSVNLIGHPAFIFKGADSRPETSSSASLGAVSVNDVTMSAIRGIWQPSTSPRGCRLHRRAEDHLETSARPSSNSIAEVTLQEGRNEVWTVIRGPRAKDASRRKRRRQDVALEASGGPRDGPRDTRDLLSVQTNK